MHLPVVIRLLQKITLKINHAERKQLREKEGGKRNRLILEKEKIPCSRTTLSRPC